MSKRDISVFSLSLLDLLFCAFGGVIVLTVVFSAIIKYEQSQREKSPDVAISFSVEYSNASSVPDTWKLVFRENPANQQARYIGSSLNIFDKGSLSYFENMSPDSQGKFMTGFEGKLKITEENTYLADTIYMSVYNDNSDPFASTPVWSNPSGQLLIEALIYKPGELPVPLKLDPIQAARLSDYDQSVPVLLELLEDGELKISTLNI